MHLWSRARAPVSARTQRADAAGDGSRRFQGSTRLPRIGAPNQNRLTRGPRGRRDRSFRKGTRLLGVRRAQDPCPVQGRGSRVVRSALYPTANPRFPTDLTGSTRVAPLLGDAPTRRPRPRDLARIVRWRTTGGVPRPEPADTCRARDRKEWPSRASFLPPPPRPALSIDRRAGRRVRGDAEDRAIGRTVHGRGPRVSLLCPASAC